MNQLIKITGVGKVQVDPLFTTHRWIGLKRSEPHRFKTKKEDDPSVRDVPISPALLLHVALDVRTDPRRDAGADPVHASEIRSRSRERVRLGVLAYPGPGVLPF